ncbi:ribokinase [Microbacterium capsulatum]|uniref:Ribokinase n=1 Tax=Microbacterium capsulatum TaxID=3041921 RepID=A0ABU0XHC9_9MICO|nr:ribokinase [Microbacterium sp. ASV81]MDQ4213570.1 ribokinase [Microbacterium sp. ASV81]
MPVVTVVGSANLDLVVEVARLPAVGETLLGRAVGRFPGGKGLNQAVAAARSGATTRLCAVVGEDEAGDVLQRAARDAGVVGDLRRTPAAPTGVAHVFAIGGDNSIVVAAGANGELRTEDAVREVAGAAVVLAQLEVPLDAVAAALAAGRAGGSVTLLNAAPAADDVLGMLADVDVLIVNETECAELGGVERLHVAGARTIVRTAGGDGVALHRAGERPLHVPAFRIDPVDTTGAGDAFCGALAAALAGGAAIEDALVRASAAGAIVARHLGATTAELTPAAIDALIAR